MNIDLRDEVLSQYDEYLNDELAEHYNRGALGGFGQYNVLAHLSTYFNNSTIIDYGTGIEGVSARALAYNETNTVYSYDIEFSKKAAAHFKSFDNIVYNIFDPIKSPKDQEVLLSSPFISLDVDPHDGIQERKICDFLIDNEWDGIMVCDDVNIGPHGGMIEFWESIDQLKYDLTSTTYAHHTGTGIICFGDHLVLSASTRENYGTFEDYVNIYGEGQLPGLVVKEDGTFLVTKDGFSDVKGTCRLSPNNKDMVRLVSDDGTVVECHRANLITD